MLPISKFYLGFLRYVAQNLGGPEYQFSSIHFKILFDGSDGAFGDQVALTVGLGQFLHGARSALLLLVRHAQRAPLHGIRLQIVLQFDLSVFEGVIVLRFHIERGRVLPRAEAPMRELMLAVGRGVDLPQLAATFQEDPHRPGDLDAGTEAQVAERRGLGERDREGEDYSQGIVWIAPQHRSPGTAQIHRSHSTALSPAAVNIFKKYSHFINCLHLDIKLLTGN